MELADILLEAYRTPSGIPRGTLNFRTLVSSNPGWAGGASGLSEFGTEQMEMIKVSEVRRLVTAERSKTTAGGESSADQAAEQDKV